MVFHVRLWRSDAALALLLEAVQDEHSFGEPHGVDGAISTTTIAFDDFQNTGTSKALEHLRCRVLVPMLRKVQGVTEKLPYFRRKRHQILLTTSDPNERLFVLCHVKTIPEIVFLDAPQRELLMHNVVLITTFMVRT